MLLSGLFGFIGLILGAIIVLIAFSMRMKFEDRRDMRRRELNHKVKEIETLGLLNNKINEIMNKRDYLKDDFVSFDAFDDTYITIDDYIYLQSFSAQNNFYLPGYLLEEFFTNIAQRKTVLSPEQTAKMGAYAYKGGRAVLENFSDQIHRITEDKKSELQQLTKQPLRYFDER
jgi:hypothetical protein